MPQRSLALESHTMKVFVAGIATETNTFAPLPTGMGHFEAMGIRRGDGSGHCALTGPMDQRLRELAAEGGHELVLGLMAFAQPAGRTVQAAWEALRDELLQGLREALPVQAVILPLHGAMVADDCDDCEGELIERVRAIVGPGVPIGVELDLHCHTSTRMLRGADVLIAFKEYPHTDMVARLEELWRIVTATAAGRIRPVTAVHDLHMVSFWHTTREPMMGFVRRMQALEGSNGVLSVSFGHGFPYGDVADNGAKLWVVCDALHAGSEAAARAQAQALADQLASEVWAMREATHPRLTPLDEVLDAVLAETSAQPVVVADRADNAGGGAMSDSTFVLRRLLERGIGNVALGAFWDLGAIACCRDAGVGARFALRLGGKCGPTSGEPVDLVVTVRAVKAEHHMTGLSGARMPLGETVWVSTDEGLDLVLISLRQQVMGIDLFTGLGINLSAKRAVVVKSSQHFHASFAPIASRVLYADTPGLLRSDMENIPFVKRTLEYWPRTQTRPCD